MKPLKSLAPFLVSLTGAVATVPAMAHGPHVRFGIGIGVPLWPRVFAPVYPPYTEHRPAYRPRSRHPGRLFTSKRATQQAPAPDNNSWSCLPGVKSLLPEFTCNNVRPGGSACLRSLRRKGKSMHRRFEVCALGLLLLGGCVTVPSGPSVMVLPGTGKSFDQFRADELDCRHYASYQTNMTPEEASANSGVSSAALGTLIGAAAGAAINGGTGAAVGAGVGLAGGTLAGTGAASASACPASQQRYDFGYTQCMYIQRASRSRSRVTLHTHGRLRASLSTARPRRQTHTRHNRPAQLVRRTAASAPREHLLRHRRTSSATSFASPYSRAGVLPLVTHGNVGCGPARAWAYNVSSFSRPSIACREYARALCCMPPPSLHETNHATR